MQVQLLHSQATEISLTPSSKEEKGNKNSFNVDFEVHYDEESNNRFYVVFDLNVDHPGNFELYIKFISGFETSLEIDEEFKKSSFPSVNAPAIAFPFLRSFVSNVTLNAGFMPAILPSINFVHFKDKREKKKLKKTK